MKELTTTSLMEYIKHAIDLESAVIAQNQIIVQYEEDSQRKKPTTLPEDIPWPDKPSDNNDNNWMAVICVVVVAALILFIIVNVSFLRLLLTGPVVAILLSFLEQNNQKDEEVKAEKMAEYNRECTIIDEENKARRKAYDGDLANWNASHSNGLNYLNSKLNESKAKLARYYSANVIFPKYQNLPALTTIYEYLLTGRCSGLAGPNGAYNLYEAEVRQNTIITQLSIIISQLEQIKYNQYTLYQEIKQIEYTTQLISSDISALNAYAYTLTQVASLNTFYAGIAAEATSAMAFYQTL